MARRIPINSFGHVDVETEDGEVVGLVMTATDEDGPVEYAFSREAARQFLRAVASFAPAVSTV